METLRNEYLSIASLKSLIALKRFEIDNVPHDADISGEVGFNSASGYIYISYDSGASIALFEGRDQQDQILMFTINDEGEEIDIQTIEEFRKLF